MSSCRPGASNLALRKNPGTLGAQEGDLGVQAWAFIDLGLIVGANFESFSDTLDKHMCFVHACFQIIFSNKVQSAAPFPRRVLWDICC